MYLYADDTVIFDSANDFATAFGSLQLKLDRVFEWCTMNKLTLNIIKIKALNFFPKSNLQLIPKFMVHGQSLDYVETYKYLGYLIDSKLKFDGLLNKLIAVIVHKLYLFSKMRPMLTQKAALAVYKSKILVYFDYSAICCRLPLIRKLQVLQNRAIRIILKLSPHTNVDHEHIDLGIWHLENRRQYFLLCLKFELSVRPDFPYIDRRYLQTRAHMGQIFQLPSSCTTCFMKSFVCQGMKKWNELAPDTRNINSFDIFKR